MKTMGILIFQSEKNKKFSVPISPQVTILINSLVLDRLTEIYHIIF